MILETVSDLMFDLHSFGRAVVKDTEEHSKSEIFEYCQQTLEKLFIELSVEPTAEGYLLVKLKDDSDRPEVRQVYWALSEYNVHEWTLINKTYEKAVRSLLDAIKSDYTVTECENYTVMIRWVG